MSDDYFARLDRVLAQLTTAGAHLDPPSRFSTQRWSALEHIARRTAVVVCLAIVLATLLVIEFPGSASGSVHRGGGLVTAAAAHPQRAAVAITAGRIVRRSV